MLFLYDYKGLYKSYLGTCKLRTVDTFTFIFYATIPY